MHEIRKFHNEQQMYVNYNLSKCLALYYNIPFLTNEIKKVLSCILWKHLGPDQNCLTPKSLSSLYYKFFILGVKEQSINTTKTKQEKTLIDTQVLLLMEWIKIKPVFLIF